MFAAVLTTIQEPTRGVVKLVEKLAEYGGLLVVAGDKQGPSHFRSQHFAEGCRIDFLALADQLASASHLARKLPVGSHSPKNVAYIHPTAAGADFLDESHDDNAPLHPCQLRSRSVPAARPV